jgi:hypothetical protein
MTRRALKSRRRIPTLASNRQISPNNACPLSTSSTSSTSCTNATTSIGELFGRELFVCRLVGGFMFSRLNRKLAIVYRILVLFLPPLISSQFAKTQSIILKELPKHMGNNLLLYTIVRSCTHGVLVFVAVFREIMYFDTLELIMRKRIDGRYFRKLKLVPSNKAHGGQLKPVLAFGTPDKSSVDGYRRWLVAMIVGTTAYLFLTEAVTRFVTKSAAFNEMQPNSVEYMKFLATFIFVEAPYLFCLVLMIILAVLCQHEGLVFISLAIFASMTDMLKRVNEQLRLTNSLCCRRVTLSKASNQELIPVTELLIQVRNVMLVLRQATGLSFALNTLFGLTMMLESVGALIVLLSVEKYLYALFCGYVFFWRLVKEIAYRYVVLMLHNEAYKVHEFYQRRLADPTAERRFEPLTNARLAEQIAQLGPSTWIDYKIEPLLKLTLSAFAFMVGLHRIAEASFQATQTGRAEQQSGR